MVSPKGCGAAKLLDPNSGAEEEDSADGLTANPEAVEDDKVPDTRSVGAGIPNSPLAGWDFAPNPPPPPPDPPNISATKKCSMITTQPGTEHIFHNDVTTAVEMWWGHVHVVT